ncbi:hypothetical protein GIB67_039978, partial [Kingdonia uniflora]
MLDFNVWLQNITSTFKVRASEVVVLDPCAETSIVEQGAKVKFPFWMAQYLRSKDETLSALDPTSLSHWMIIKVKPDWSLTAPLLFLFRYFSFDVVLDCAIVHYLVSEEWSAAIPHSMN